MPRQPTNQNFYGGGQKGGRGSQTCHRCGNPGHIAKNCPQGNSGGGPSGGFQGNPGGPSGGGGGGDSGSTISLPEISAGLKTEIERENTLVTRFKGETRTAVQKPCRPEYGTQGAAVEFRANYFPINLPRELLLYRYNIKIDAKYDKDGKKLPEPKNKKLKQIIKILLNSVEFRNRKFHIATDFKSTLICSGKIPQHSWGPKIKYFHEDDNAPGNDPQDYHLHIEEMPQPLKVSELQAFLDSTESVAPYEHRESMLQALNILLGHHAKSTRMTTMVGGNRAYTDRTDNQTEKLSLSAGVEAIRGYFLSVRLASFRTLVNVNVSHGAFYESVKLTSLIDSYQQVNPAEKHTDWWNLQSFLRDLKVKTEYLKDKDGNKITSVRSIKALANKQDGESQKTRPHIHEFAAGPKNVWFYLDDERDFSAQKEKWTEAGVIMDKYISIKEFFEYKHQIRNIAPNDYPVVNFGTRGDPRYVPAEVCMVEPGQIAKLKPQQTDRMIDFAVRKPSLNEKSINSSGISTLGLFPAGDKMVQFGVGIAPRMITVPGRMLRSPTVLYKDNKLAKSTMGGWNLREVKFQTPVPKATGKRLEKWACLRLDDSSTNFPAGTYESAIIEFRKNLGSYGITTYHPPNASLKFDQKRGNFFDVINGRSIEDTIHVFHREQMMNILLIILPTKNTTLYNRIKGFCDRTEGIHTVCVTAKGDKPSKGDNFGKGDKFYKCNGTYFGNVALKFNLKLGGTNHILNDVEMGIVSQGKTMVVGIDVVHPSPGSDKASVASMVASINKDLAQWPVDLRVQVRKGREMLDKIHDMLESRLALWKKHNKVYPENILIYRDGVSESQYQEVLDEELEKMRTFCQKRYNEAGKRAPRFTLIIVGKRHHTRFFPPSKHPASDETGNSKRGLVVDRGITEARNWDFFLQSHDAIKGTARPAHYYVLWDEIFTNIELDRIHPAIRPADRLEQLTHSLCYLFSRATKAVSIPAPVYYADIACERANRYLAKNHTDSESAMTNSMKMTDGQREKFRGDLQKEIDVNENLKDEMFYI